MSFTDEYLALRDKRKKKKVKDMGDIAPTNSFSKEYSELRNDRLTKEVEKETRSVASGFPTRNTISAPYFNKAKEKEEEKDGRKWFQKGEFEDGYQFGDITKTIIGSGHDLSENLISGVVGMGEKIVDFGATIGALMNESTTMQSTQDRMLYNVVSGKSNKEIEKDIKQSQESAIEVKKNAAEFVKKDLYDEEKVAKKIVRGISPIQKYAGIDPETDSVFGEKSDALIQSAGQLGATVGLQAVGVPWFLTTGATSFGAEAESALQQGATFEEAALSATISAGAEILTEKLSGGIKFGGKTLDDVLLKPLTDKISSKATKTLVNLGIDAVGEGGEEVVSQFFSNLGSSLYKEEDLTDILASEEALDEYLESFIGGAVLGGGSSVINAAVDAKKAKLTENEQKVVDKVYNDRIAEAEEGNKTLSKKDKAKIYDEVVHELEKGYISTDTIEGVLGGENYKTYQSLTEQEKSLTDEIEQLESMPNEQITVKQKERLLAAREELENLNKNSNKSQLKTQISDEVFGIVKNDRLAESYNERTRRSQVFEADLTKYNAKQAEVVKKAIDSGILNNTNRTHEFVDMIAKISADKGVLFDFTNNTKLKDTGFAVDGKSVNGYVTKDGVTLNIDSQKSLNSVVGHEITHVLEGTELYTELQSAVIEYAKTKNDYTGRYDTLTELYKGIKGANIDGELTADLVGDYLFTDSDFISKLSTEHRNVFQKIYDEIKYLYKVATAGSKEARELEKVKRAFDKAYRESGSAKTDTQYSLSDSDGKQLTKEQQDYFKDSKMRDDNGNLKVMYHGSENAGFHEFSQQFSDDDTSFFFVDRNDVAATYSGTSETYAPKAFKTVADANSFFAEIGATEYEVVEKDGKYTLLDDGDEVATSDDLSKIYDEWRDWSGLGYGDANYKVYLNLKNPLVVDGKGRPWNKIDAEFSQEVYDKYQSLTAEEKAALVDLAEWEDFRLFNREIQEAKDNDLASAYAKIGEDVNIYDLFSVAADNFSEESLRENSRNYLKTRDYAKRAKEQGYDGVIFNNIIDNGGFSNGDEGASTVAIAFESNQIKSVANDKPTSKADIRYSLSAETDRNYLAAVERGDTETAQKMVDEAAKKAGYTVKGLHATNADFTVFDVDKTSDFNFHGKGIYFTNSQRDVEYNYENHEGPDPWQKIEAKAYELAYDKYGLSYEDTLTGDSEVIDKLNECYDEAISEFKTSLRRVTAYLKFDNPLILKKGDASDYDLSKYDGIIDEQVYENIGHAGMDENTVHYVVFNPRNIKSADAITYDDNGNVIPLSKRFNPDNPDIRFSLSKPVEETKDLIAAHNLHANELLKQLDMGGMPMPSIAVTKADSVHNEYGDVTLVLHKSAIDPKANKANKVYGGDVWSPTYPKIEYKPSDEVAQKISSKYYELYQKYGNDDLRPMYRYANDLEDTLTGRGGETALLEELYEDTGMMQVYLLDTGKGKVETVQEEIRTELSDAEVEMNEFFIKELGADVVDGVMVADGENPMAHRKQYWENHGEKIKETYKKLLSQEYGFTEEEVQNVLDNTKTFDYLKFVRDAHKYRKNGRVTTRTEPNRAATEDAIRKAAGNGYKEWIDNLFKGVEEKSGIRNNTDYFTPSGNRRSWDALHWENTLENVVRVMKAQDNGDGVFFSGHGIWGVAAKEYKSIADVKNDADRLKHLPEEEYEKIRGELGGRLQEIAENIMDKGERNQFIAVDNALSCIVDAVRNSKTEAGIMKNLKQYQQLTVTQKDVADIVSLVNDIANMPTGYFEAKPQRAVGFDEVGVFVIPYNADAKLKQELLNRGYAIAEYDPNVEGDRQKVVNQFEEYKFSLSNVGETPKTYGNYNTYGKDVALETAPVQEEVTPTQEEVTPTQEDVAPIIADSQNETLSDNLPDEFAPLSEDEANYLQGERLASLDDADMPPEREVINQTNQLVPDSPFEDMDIEDVGSVKTKAYMYENPEVKPFFQAEAQNMLYELKNSTKGQRFWNGDLYYETNGERGFWGEKRQTSEEIAYLLDGGWKGTGKGYTYAEIEKGLNAIIEDNGKENNACSKRIEFLLDERLRKGYTDFIYGNVVQPNQGYINLLNEKQITEYNEEAFKRFMESDEVESYIPDNAPVTEEIAPVMANTQAVDISPVKEEYEAIRPKKETRTNKEPKLIRVKDGETEGGKDEVKGHTAEVLDTEPEAKKKNRNWFTKAMGNFADKGFVFENLSLKTKNRELMGKWNHTLSSEARAQWLIGKGTDGVKSLNDIRKEVESTGKTKQFYEYMYHKHNVDRMKLEERYDDTPNKPVFGDAVSAEFSKEIARQYEKENPQFKEYAKDVYTYMNYLRKQMVDNGVISQETADLWANMYPHYVPIRRAGDEGLNINVPLDTRKTGVNAPIKRAKGGSRDILPLFDTMAMRTEQTFKAIAKNSFGVELLHTLDSAIENEKTNLDEVIDSIDAQDGLLQEGKNGMNPTFTVFENGEKVTFEITEDMYDALKPTSSGLLYINKVLNKASNIHRGLLTEYNPVFMFNNAIKDVQDVFVNSQHAARTYANIPEAIYQLASKGKWYTEYMENGGEQNTYFDNKTNTFNADDNAFKKVFGLPFNAMSKANNFIERVPRIAEYMASRKSGRSVEVSMLDAARVTTNFAAGGDVTKFLNRNGATFLNASVQGAMQQVRNVREAKANGLKGWVSLATRFTLAGASAYLLNHLLWDDDEEYEELSDYVKQNYYVVAKYGDGKFVRIPKGRTLAVIQDAVEQVSNAVTGNDDVDFASFAELVISNLAPNNPVDNNILSPIIQVANNETWYGDDLVPTRLQDLPKAEQFDESTDAISKWLGEKQNILSPYQINYLLDQYSGGVGDVFLPMLTPEAESGDNSFFGNVIAPMKDKFTTDSVMNNQNVSDFYDLNDELTKNANSSKATDDDILKSKFINAVNSKLGELYAEKRQIQSSDLADDEKYSAVREIQQEINEIAKSSMSDYEDVSVTDGYATIGNLHYRLNKDGEWQKITDKQLDKQEKVTSGLDITPSEYWKNKEEYDYAYEYPEKYAVAKAVGGYETYKAYSKELYDIKADKDSSGKSITGSRKEKVIDYVNNLDAEYGERIILFKSEYPADDTYNYDIIEYLNGREDISYEEMETILKKLGFTVLSDGTVQW